MYGWTSRSDVPANSTISSVGGDSGGIGNGFSVASVVVRQSVFGKREM